MILVAPDKFKGTLTAVEAADIIASELKKLESDVRGDLTIIKAPMADGGEGTASVLCRAPQWDKHDLYYVNRATRTAVIDSSAVIGLQGVDLATHDILRASSAPLGLKVREILKGGCDKVVIGIGGTATCDAGQGFLEALGMEKLSAYRNSIIGLSDVRVPLVAPGADPSALTFAPQKGASDMDMEVLRRRLDDAYRRCPHRSPFDGAGGGLGFAIASVIGAKCYDGAKYVLDNYDIDWPKVRWIVTGEGCVDRQTGLGKVVGTLRRIAAERNIPILTIGGRVDDDMRGSYVLSTSDFFPDLPLNHDTAALRLRQAVREYFML